MSLTAVPVPSSSSPDSPARASASVTVRVLPPDEWDKLAGLPLVAHGTPDPQLASVVVAETADGTIVGVWAAMLAVHLDGLWIDPAHRRTPARVALKLLRAMKAHLRALRVPQCVTLVQTPAVLMLALKAGFTRVPGDLLLLDLTQPTPHDAPADASEG